MRVYGVSQSTGAERRLLVDRADQGRLLLSITDHVGNKERARILVVVEDLLAAVTDPPAGGCTIEGIFPPHGTKMLLDVEVRRNEIQFRARAGDGEGEGADVAVGLDDLQDVLEKFITRG
jgi:hypothetical protein